MCEWVWRVHNVLAVEKLLSDLRSKAQEIRFEKFVVGVKDIYVWLLHAKWHKDSISVGPVKKEKEEERKRALFVCTELISLSLKSEFCLVHCKKWNEVQNNNNSKELWQKRIEHDRRLLATLSPKAVK